MRNIREVITQIIHLIPVERAELRLALHRLRVRAAYTAPECIGQVWANASDTLEEALDGLPRIGWIGQIHDIWTDTAAKDDHEVAVKRYELIWLLQKRGWSEQVAIDCALYTHPYSN